MNVSTFQDPLQLDIETLTSAWTLLGHRLDDRTAIRHRQDASLTRRYLDTSRQPLADAEQELDFVCAPLDLLIDEVDGRLRFHILEINGTGFGGITNLPPAVLRPILDSLRQVGTSLTEPDGVVLLGISGKEDPERPRMNHLMHEKLLFGQALLRGLRQTHPYAHLTTADHTLAGHSLKPGPTVILGYMKDLIDQIEVRQGRLAYQGRPISGILNDRFCVNTLDHFGVAANLEHFRPINTCFLAGSDKATAYRLIREAVRGTPDAVRMPGTDFEIVYDRSQLITAVQGWLAAGRPAVIKPHGTGIGHGIEFFLDPDAPEDEVHQQIDRSIHETETFYRIRGGAFPYTVCDYIDARTIEAPHHPLKGHKYEVRIVVLRRGDALHAFPAVAKIASAPFDPANPERSALINNVTASTSRTRRGGAEFSLPLADPRALETLGLNPDVLCEVGRICTRVLRHVLDDLREHPHQHGFVATTRGAS